MHMSVPDRLSSRQADIDANVVSSWGMAGLNPCLGFWQQSPNCGLLLRREVEKVAHVAARHKECVPRAYREQVHKSYGEAVAGDQWWMCLAHAERTVIRCLGHAVSVHEDHSANTGPGGERGPNRE